MCVRVCVCQWQSKTAYVTDSLVSSFPPAPSRSTHLSVHIISNSEQVKIRVPFCWRLQPKVKLKPKPKPKLKSKWKSKPKLWKSEKPIQITAAAKMAKRMQRIEQVRGREREGERGKEEKHKRDGQIAGEIWNITAASSATEYCKLSHSSFRILPVQSACFTISSLSVRERAPDQFDFWLGRVLVRLLVLASTYYSSSSSSSTAALAIQALVAVLLLLPLFIPLPSLSFFKLLL